MNTVTRRHRRRWMLYAGLLFSLGLLFSFMVAPAHAASPAENRLQTSQPDLTATKTNSVGGTAVLNVQFNWIITVQNIGTIGADFFADDSILVDELPDAGATFGTPYVTNISGGVSGPITCEYFGFDMQCYADGATVTIPIGGSFQVVIPTTPTALGTLINPDSGDYICEVDDGNVIAESNEANNDCADTVTVVSQPPVRPSPTPNFDVTLTASVDPTSANVGDTVYWTFVITNPGTQGTAGLTFRADLPSNLTYVNLTTTSGALRTPMTLPTIWVDMPGIPPGDSVTIVIETTVNALSFNAPPVRARIVGQAIKATRHLLQSASACVQGSVAVVGAQACLTVLPAELPETGGQPVSPLPVFAALGALIATGVLGGLLLRRRAASQ